MKCSVCSLDVADDQPSRELPELAGGGRVHQGCWEEIKPWVARLMKDLGIDDYLGILEDLEDLDDGESQDGSQVLEDG